MNPAHRSLPGPLMDKGNPENRRPNEWGGIHSNNHIRKRNCKGTGLYHNWDSDQSWHSAKPEELKEEKGELENNKHSTCLSEQHNTLTTTVGSGHWHKKWPCLGRTWYGKPSQNDPAAKNALSAKSHLTYQMAEVHTQCSVSQHNPKSKSAEWEKVQIWKN